jgi:transposase-like protein
VSERAAPYYCPYCGDEDLMPEEGAAVKGEGYPWACLSCARVFRVKYVGLRSASFSAGGAPSRPTEGSE